MTPSMALGIPYSAMYVPCAQMLYNSIALSFFTKPLAICIASKTYLVWVYTFQCPVILTVVQTGLQLYSLHTHLEGQTMHFTVLVTCFSIHHLQMQVNVI